MSQGTAQDLRRGELELLTDLVRARSYSGEEERAVSVLIDHLARSGLTAHRDGAGNAVGIGGPADAAPEEAVMLLGHIDTAPGFWTPNLTQTSVHARGAVDAKGSLATFAAAAARAHASGRLRRRVVVVGAVEEESPTSRGARQVALDHRPAFCVIGEPSGTSGITVGYKGRVLVNLTVERSRAHSSRPEPTAAEEAITFFSRVRERAAEHPGDGIFNSLDAHLLHMSSDSDGFDDLARVTIGLRLPPAVTVPAVEVMVRELAPPGSALEFGGGEPAVRTPRTGRLPAVFAGAIRATGLAPHWRLKGGTSDMNIVVPHWNCPAVAYGPGDSAMDHTPHETLELADYATAISVMERVLLSL
ncbi:MAG: M20/M25/M40 family metallo-hydrolase [Candidatus Dormibacteria bacterium]